MEEEFHFIADDDDPWVAKMGGTSFQSGHDLTNSTHKSGNVGKQTGPIHTRKQSAKRGLSLLYSAIESRRVLQRATTKGRTISQRALYCPKRSFMATQDPNEPQKTTKDRCRMQVGCSNPRPRRHFRGWGIPAY